MFIFKTQLIIHVKIFSLKTYMFARVYLLQTDREMTDDNSTISSIITQVWSTKKFRKKTTQWHNSLLCTYFTYNSTMLNQSQ